MKELEKENINYFVEYYHYLHDSFITHIYYDINKSQIQLSIDVYWAGNNQIKNDTTYVMNKEKLKIFFNSVKEYKCQNISPSDYIDHVYIKSIKIEDREYMCFANEVETPYIYIICDNIQYEKIVI